MTNLSRGLALAVTLIVAACASMPHPKLEAARSGYARINDNPDVAQTAPVALRRAQKYIERAEQELQAGNEAATAHFAYLAQNYVEVAAAQGERQGLQEQVEDASARRRELRLRAERLQSLSAQAEAASARQRAAELEAQLRKLQAKQTDRGLVLTLGDVLFATDKSQLRPGGRRTVQRLAQFLKEYENREVLIEGHTDARGTAAYNQRLSQRRAQAVNQALMAFGVDPSRTRSVGLGEQYPVATNDTATGRQQNRRVEIVISDPEGNIGTRGA